MIDPQSQAMQMAVDKAEYYASAPEVSFAEYAATVQPDSNCGYSDNNG
jgi:hypothetical protein